MATVADAQHATLQALNLPLPSPEAIARAQQHSMPLVPALDGERNPQWRAVLTSCSIASKAPGSSIRRSRSCSTGCA
jgi:formate dehydrogenase maturation protein FdhE